MEWQGRWNKNLMCSLPVQKAAAPRSSRSPKWGYRTPFSDAKPSFEASTGASWVGCWSSRVTGRKLLRERANNEAFFCKQSHYTPPPKRTQRARTRKQGNRKRSEQRQKWRTRRSVTETTGFQFHPRDQTLQSNRLEFQTKEYCFLPLDIHNTMASRTWKVAVIPSVYEPLVL